MPNRFPVGGASYSPIAQEITANLQVSGDTSGCEFDTWFTHNQVINAMFKRIFVYDSTPTPGTGGVVSACPQVSFNYIDCNYTIQVSEEKELASYCSGLYQPQQLITYSDSTLGGLGVSGTFITSAVGYFRRKWLVTDEESTCMQGGNAQIGKLPGSYNSAFDTSATLGSHIAELLMHCEKSCPTFVQNLVEY